MRVIRQAGTYEEDRIFKAVRGPIRVNGANGASVSLPAQMYLVIGRGLANICYLKDPKNSVHYSDYATISETCTSS